MTITANDPFIPPILPPPTLPVKLKLPANEKRAHKFFVLDNGLQAIVVSDPTSERAAAALTVGVGNAYDALNFNGCAHFCEHLLFQGSAKFPGSGEYKRYIKENDGRCNASTSQHLTTYFFEVAAPALLGGLDRFTGFFVDPLFSKDSVDREVNAIHSEYLGKYTSMGRLEFSAVKGSGVPGHPFANNGCGTIDTLLHTPIAEGRDPRAELISWYETHYSADRMHISVTGTQSVDELEQAVRQRLDGVPRRNTVIDFPKGPWFSDEALKSVAYYKPIAQEQTLIMAFQVPRHDHLNQVHPFRVISRVLQHKGPGSLYAYLKATGWSTSLYVQAAGESSVFPYLEIEVQLTEDGVVHWKDVVSTVFAALEVYRASDLEPTFHELRQMADIEFDFKDQSQPAETARSAAVSLARNVPREEVLSASTFGAQYDAEQVAAAFQYIVPRKASIVLFSPTKPQDIHAEMDQKEVIYDRMYARQVLDDSLFTDIPSIPELRIPPANPYIPARLEVKEQDTSAIYPTVLQDTPLSRLWHKADTYKQPKASINIALQSPLLGATPRNRALASMLVQAFYDATEDDRYYAGRAGLSCRVTSSTNNADFEVNFAGFTDKLAEYVETILSNLKTFKPDPKRFPQILDKAKRAYESQEFTKPWELLASRVSYVVRSVAWATDELLDELKLITIDDLVQFRDEVLARLHIQTLVHGNLTRDESTALQATIEKTLSARPLSKAEQAIPRCLNLHEGDRLWATPVPNPEAPTNGVAIVLQGPSSDATYAQRAAFRVVCRLITQPFFHSLRTTQQLGYAVAAIASDNEAYHTFHMRIESSRDPIFVESRMIDFIDTFAFTEADTERHTQAFINALLVKPRNLGAETAKYWSEIERHTYDFTARDSFIAAARALTHADIVDAFERYIATNSSSRRCLTIHMRAVNCPQTPEEEEKQVASPRWIPDIVEFKGSLAPARAFAVFSLMAHRQLVAVRKPTSKL